jgi:hypothetical protein
MIHLTWLLPNYITLLGKQQMMKEYPEPMPIRGKDLSISVLPSCPTCGATLDLKLLQSFGSRHIISNDAKSYYCNNPLCGPDEEEGRHRLLPFSWNSHYQM